MNKLDKHKVSLIITDFAHSIDDLTTKLDLLPTKTASKGQEYFNGPPHKKIKKIWQWNYWMYQEVIEDNECDIGDQISEFISKIIVPKKRVLHEIKHDCELELGVVQYIYQGCNPGFHIEKKELKILAEIDCEIDIDFYVLSGPKL